MSDWVMLKLSYTIDKLLWFGNRANSLLCFPHARIPRSWTPGATYLVYINNSICKSIWLAYCQSNTINDSRNPSTYVSYKNLKGIIWYQFITLLLKEKVSIQLLIEDAGISPSDAPRKAYINIKEASTIDIKKGRFILVKTFENYEII